jgi:hypothetical protein
MKQEGKCIIGDPISVGSYTADWMTVRLHPIVYYRRYDEIQEGLKTSKGLYAEIDQGQFVVIRFSEKDDMTAFHRRHHEYV